jgi:thymidylate kinase
LRRLAGRFLQPPGITVILAGADGCGKSTAAEKLVESLRGTFHPNKSLRVHWKPAVFLRKRRAARPPTTDPHGKPPRGVPASVALLFYHWTEFLIGCWTQFQPVLFRNGLVLVDRYHFDFVVDPRRFRLAALPRLARTLFRLLPSPDLVFLLDAPPEVLQSRKREVPVGETARQREAYRSEIGRLPNARIVDAAQPPEAVGAELVRATLDYMAARQVRRGAADEN